MKNIFFRIIVLSIVICSCNSKSQVESGSDYWWYDTVFTSNSVYEVYTMKDTITHGVMHLYNYDKEIEERLYINNRAIVGRKYKVDTTGISYSYFYNINDTLKPIGFLWYEKNTLKKTQQYCSYHEVFAADTIRLGQEYNLKIVCNIGDYMDFNIQLEIGQINLDYQIEDADTILNSNTSELEFSTTNYSEGLNLLTGIIRVYEDSIDISNDLMYYRTYSSHPQEIAYVFYKQFYVLAN